MTLKMPTMWLFIALEHFKGRLSRLCIEKVMLIDSFLEIHHQSSRARWVFPLADALYQTRHCAQERFSVRTIACRCQLTAKCGCVLWIFIYKMNENEVELSLWSTKVLTFGPLSPLSYFARPSVSDKKRSYLRPLFCLACNGPRKNTFVVSASLDTRHRQ